MKYNTMILTIFFILLSFLHVPTNALAQSENFGLAMNGTPKYSAQSPHLDYVNPDAPKGGTLKMSAIGSYDNLNPFTIKGVAAEGLELGYDRLMRRIWDEPFTMYPLIAQRADIAPDRSSVTFHINPKARFHDASPITAHDVMFSFEALRDHGRPNMRRIYKLVDKAEVKNDHEIYFHFGEGYDRETIMIFAMMPVLSKTWWSERKFDETLTDIPLLSGAYKIAANDTGRKITYERVPDYWAADLFVNKGHYNFNTIIYDYFRDDTIALQAFKKGDLSLRREMDIAKWESAYDGLESSGIVKFAAPHQRPERATGFIFNLRRPPFDDINVRKALSLAFDYDWIGKNLFYGQMKPISSVFPNSVLAAPPQISQQELALIEPWKDHLPPDSFAPREGVTSPAAANLRSQLKQADELLRASGWIIENGKRVNGKTKTTLSFEVLINTVQDERIATNYKSTLSKLGVDMHIRRLDSSTFTDRKMNYNYDMISLFWQNSLSPGTEQMVYWSCTAAQNTGSLNYSGICNPALDHFAAQIAQTKDYDALQTHAHILDRILISQHIFVPFFYKGVDYIAHAATIEHPQTTPIYGVVTESWWAKTP